MDLARVAELNLSFQHRHDDGSFGTFEPERSPHSSADHDPERDWASGTIYKCTTLRRGDHRRLRGAGYPPP